MTLNLVSIKERIATATMQDGTRAPFVPLFTPEERDLVLKAINNYADIYQAKREYPPRFPKDHSNKWIRLAWTLLDDNVPPSMLSRDARFLIAGLIAGAMNETEKMARERK